MSGPSHSRLFSKPYNINDLKLSRRGQSQENVVMGPAGPEAKNDCAGESQQQITKPGQTTESDAVFSGNRSRNSAFRSHVCLHNQGLVLFSDDGGGEIVFCSIFTALKEVLAEVEKNSRHISTYTYMTYIYFVMLSLFQKISRN
jgi:hypothetical protein